MDIAETNVDELINDALQELMEAAYNAGLHGKPNSYRDIEPESFCNEYEAQNGAPASEAVIAFHTLAVMLCSEAWHRGRTKYIATV